MTFQMYLLEEKMASEQRGLQIGLQRGKEAVAVKLIGMGLSFNDIRKATDLPPERNQQLAANLESENLS